MHKRSSFRIAFALFATMLTGAVHAEGNTGFYVGGGIGSAVVDVRELQFSERDMAFKILAGYALSDFIALEAAYFDGGDPREEFGANQAIVVTTNGYNASLVLRARTGSEIVIFGKVGYAQYNFEISQLTDNVPVTVEERTDRDLNLGLGFTYKMFDRWIFRLEYERAEVTGTDFQLASFVAGIQF
jgi:opacity protein-like surface antigen